MEGDHRPEECSSLPGGPTSFFSSVTPGRVTLRKVKAVSRSREQNREYQREYRARKRAEKEAAAASSPAATEATAPKSPPPTTSRGRHSKAVTRLLKATGLLHVPEEAPLIELLKDLAVEMDDGGDTRTAAQYRAALKDVRQVLTAAPGRPKASPDVQPATSESEKTTASSDADVAEDAKVSSLAGFKSRHQIP